MMFLAEAIAPSSIRRISCISLGLNAGDAAMSFASFPKSIRRATKVSNSAHNSRVTESLWRLEPRNPACEDNIVIPSKSLFQKHHATRSAANRRYGNEHRDL